jgi:hypothetical protein
VAVPLKLTDCWLSLALSVMLRLAFRIPTAFGAKVTWSVVVPAGASEIGSESEVKAKSLGFAPVKAILLMISVVEPELVICTGCAVLVVLVF